MIKRPFRNLSVHWHNKAEKGEPPPWLRWDQRVDETDIISLFLESIEQTLVPGVEFDSLL